MGNIAFKDSRTKENLMRAFAGESQARNRYTISASTAKKNNLHVVEAIFTFTANQEKEHAEIFWNLLKEMSGNSIEISAGYPVEVFDNVLKLLRAAENNENEEYEDVYRNFADIAKEEGFFEISSKFDNIAKIEKTHSNRFKLYADMLENNQLFISDVETSWVCLNCGMVFNGKSAPTTCPVCAHNQGYFIRAELVPFGGEIYSKADLLK